MKLELLRARVEYQGAILGVICAVVASLLLLGQQKTYEPIQQRLAEDRQQTLAQVLPVAYYDNDPLNESMTITDAELSKKPVVVYLAKKEENLTAVAFQIETEGYGGTIVMLMALDKEGEILGLRTLSHKETPGLADKIEIGKSQWVESFNGESLQKTPKPQWAVKKDGGKFDQFTGATITPRAIVQGVVKGLEFYTRHAQALAVSTDKGATDEQ